MPHAPLENEVMKITSFLLVCLASFAASLTACSKSAPYEGAKDRLERLSPQERKTLAPNELFIAVVNGDVNAVESISANHPQLLLTRNQETGDSPLGVAIQMGEQDCARALLEKLPQEEFFKGNAQGESLVFQAARAGWEWMIKDIADRYYSTLGSLNDYEFSDLDFKNHAGQRALFVARTGSVAETLETQYYRGFMEWPFWKFILQNDDQEQNFLHQAAKDARTDLLRWAVSRLCRPNFLQSEDRWWLWRDLGYLVERGQRGFQTYVGGLGLGLDAKINAQDLLGKTPLHDAAESARLESLQVIASCPWIDPSLEDVQGNIPLQSLLLSFDQKVQKIPEEQMKSLRFMVELKPKMRSWFVQKSDLVNHQNEQGDTALHMAARLSDRGVYEFLSAEGNTEIKNKAGLSPRDIFTYQTEKSARYGN